MYSGLCQSPVLSHHSPVDLPRSCALQMEKVQFISHTVDTMAGHWALNEVDCVPVTRVQAAQKAAQSPSRVPVGIHQIS